MSSLKHDLEKLARKVGRVEDAKRLAIDDAGKTRKAHEEIVEPLRAKVASLTAELELAEGQRKKAQDEAGAAHEELALVEQVLDQAVTQLQKAKIKFDPDAVRREIVAKAKKDAKGKVADAGQAPVTAPTAAG
jgi:chromosome segregation ATPase